MHRARDHSRHGAPETDDSDEPQLVAVHTTALPGPSISGDALVPQVPRTKPLEDPTIAVAHTSSNWHKSPEKPGRQTHALSKQQPADCILIRESHIYACYEIAT